MSSIWGWANGSNHSIKSIKESKAAKILFSRHIRTTCRKGAKGAEEYSKVGKNFWEPCRLWLIVWSQVWGGGVQRAGGRADCTARTLHRLRQKLKDIVASSPGACCARPMDAIVLQTVRGSHAAHGLNQLGFASRERDIKCGIYSINYTATCNLLCNWACRRKIR